MMTNEDNFTLCGIALIAVVSMLITLGNMRDGTTYETGNAQFLCCAERPSYKGPEARRAELERNNQR